MDTLSNELSIGVLDLKKSKFINIYPPFIAAKFIILRLLEFFKCVIWFDIDMLITNDISELLMIDCDIAWKNDVGNLLQRIHRIFIDDPNSEKKCLQFSELKNISDKTLTPNGGLIILHDSFDYIEAINVAKKFIQKFILETNGSSIDEVSFAVIVHILKLKLYELPDNYNSTFIKSNNNTKIFHFAGNTKPWKDQFYNLICWPWRINCAEFLQITGQSSDLTFLFQNVRDEYIKIMRIIQWNNFFLKYGIDFIENAKLSLDFSREYVSFICSKFLEYRIYQTAYINRYFCIFEINNKFLSKHPIIINNIKNILLNYGDFLSEANRNGKIRLRTKIMNDSEIKSCLEWLYSQTKFIKEIC